MNLHKEYMLHITNVLHFASVFFLVGGGVEREVSLWRDCVLMT